MKTSAIVRIILFSFVILLLLGLLAAGLGLGLFMFEIDIGNTQYISGSGSVDAEQIKQLEIEWASGSVNVNTGDGTEIIFSETGTAAEGQEMVYSIDNGKLKICYSKPAIQIGFFSYSDKDLTITVPSDWFCEELKIESASADIAVSHLTGNTAELENASGECQFVNCQLKQLDVESASGNIHYSGTLDFLECDAASADVVATLQNTPQQINMDSASGDLDLTLPESSGFSAKLDAISGKFQSEFSTTTENNRYVHGDGSCKIDVDCVSGNIYLRKAS